MKLRPIRSYRVEVYGFDPVDYSARSPAKARWRAYNDYRICSDVSFGEFLQRSTIRRIADPDGIGRRVVIAGLPATVVIGRVGTHVAFMRDDGDVIFFSHPLDVVPA